MLPDRVSNPGPQTYESGALPIALRGPAPPFRAPLNSYYQVLYKAVLSVLFSKRKASRHCFILSYWAKTGMSEFMLF